MSLSILLFDIYEEDHKMSRASNHESIHIHHPTVLAVILSLFTSMLLTGCFFSIGGGTETYDSFSEITIPENFAFASARTVKFTITKTERYSEDGITLIPLSEELLDVLYQDETGDHVIGGGVTDSAGAVEFDVRIPASVLKVVIRSRRPYMISRDVSLPLSTLNVNLSLAPPVETDSELPATYTNPFSRGIVEGSSKAPPAPIPFVSNSGYLALSSWDTSLGLPSAINKNSSGKRPANPFKQSFLDNVGASFPEYKKVPLTNPSYLTVGDKSNVILTADAEVGITFISEGAAYRNTLAYFVYPNGKALVAEPKKSDLVIVFPNASASGSSGALLPGDSINLRNPVQYFEDGSINPYYQTTVFNKGYTISWVVIPDAFRSTGINEYLGRYYSLWNLNRETGTQIDKSHAALLLYNIDPYTGGEGKLDPVLLLGFEDLNRVTGDNDFNDILFSITSSPYTAVDTVDMPVARKLDPSDRDGDKVLDIYDEYPDDSLRASSVSYPSTTGYGTALFEDLWPSIGDFDFNDLVADFRYKTVRNAAGDAVELIATIILKAAGGTEKSGLAFTLPVPESTVTGVSRSATTGLSVGAPFVVNLKGFEVNGSNSVSIPVFNSAHAIFGIKEGEDKIVNTDPASSRVLSPVEITTTVSFAPGLAASRITGAAVDLFLVGQGDGTKRKEIHAVGFNPTVLAAGSTLFGSRDDNSPVSGTGIFYRSKKTAKSSAGAPWAIISASQVKHPVERRELPSAYLHFGEWVVSSGTTFTDWYNKEKTGYADTSGLYLK